MRVLIISDTHGHAENLSGVLERIWPIDALIHCGDVEEKRIILRSWQNVLRIL